MKDFIERRKIRENKREEKQFRKEIEKVVTETLDEKNYIGKTFESLIKDPKEYSIVSKLDKIHFGEEDGEANGLVMAIIDTKRESHKEKWKDALIVDAGDKEIYELDGFGPVGYGISNFFESPSPVYGFAASFKPLKLVRDVDRIVACYKTTYWNPEESLIPQSEIEIKTFRKGEMK